MKILNSVSSLYQQIHPSYQNLKDQVDVMIRADKRESWHYFGRLKSVYSYALKLETGRVPDPTRPEDFFACTLVVENLNQIQEALTIINQKFTIVYRRPLESNFTSKTAFSFPFDDLRLYLKIMPIDYLPENPLNEYVFELQIKTFLQHAWSIATHDLIYKGGKVSWAKERVAYQIKAMLEQAEVSISGVEQLAGLQELAKENNETRELNAILDFLESKFAVEALPTDRLTLSKIINDLLRNLNLNLNDISTYLDTESNQGRGVQLLDLSLFAIILQSIINQNPTAIEAFFSRAYRFKKNRLFIPLEISIDHLSIEEPVRMVRIQR